MKNLHFLIIALTLLCLQNVLGEKDKSVKTELDSIEIASKSLGFYDWYFSNLDIARPEVEWIDTIPILNVENYVTSLKELEIVSDIFLVSEKKRIKICQDSLYNIDHKEVIKYGCSVGEFYSACQFLDYYYWMYTQEKYHGYEIKNIHIDNGKATCQLLFYYKYLNKKEFNRRFICIIHLSKYDNNWLIDSIERIIK